MVPQQFRVFLPSGDRCIPNGDSVTVELSNATKRGLEGVPQLSCTAWLSPSPPTTYN